MKNSTTPRFLTSRGDTLTVTRFARRRSRLLRNINKARRALNLSEPGSRFEAKAAQMFRTAKAAYRTFKQVYGTSQYGF